MEKVFLVGIHLKNSGKKIRETHDSLDELVRLTETAGGSVVGKTVQSLISPDPATFIGKGKAWELTQQARKNEFATLIFDEELKAVQHKNLTELIPAKILDRTRLILDIFAKRARTRDGILQVELAQISYLLPRITERYGRFEQQVGGIGTRGPGERKLEVEARHIRDRISLLKKKIDLIKLHREVARERRHRVPLPIVAIVGYTNSGKSTLLKKLVEIYGKKMGEIYTDDKLFATLDPMTRRIRLPSGRWALFTDTVGFIRKLPHHLVAAFRSTLEETIDADLLIHLVDFSDQKRTEHSKTVNDILNSLSRNGDSLDKRIMIVYNKIDLASNFEGPNLFINADESLTRADSAKPIYISAVKGMGIYSLLNCIEQKLSEKMVETDIWIPFKKSGILPSLYRLGKVENTLHSSRGIKLHLKIERAHWGKVQKLLNNGKLNQ